MRRSRSPLRHSQGGMGFLSAHRPLLAALAPASNAFSFRSFGAYLRDHQAKPAPTSSWFRFMPSGRMTSPTMRPYLSVVWTWTLTSLRNAHSDVNRSARLPKGCPCSGQSIPCRWTFTARLPRITEIVSPSETPTTLPVKVSVATAVLTQAIWKSEAWGDKATDGNKRIRRSSKICCLGHLMNLW